MTTRRWSLPATRDELRAVFGSHAPLIGMVHLLPLPGAPRWGGSMEAVVDRAARDAEALVEGGMDGVLVENFGDAPFHSDRVPSETIAGMGRAIDAVRRVVGERPTGLNVLRNDARSGVGIAAATGACFLRVNVHAGVMFTDQGVLEGRAAETLRARAALVPDLLILADVLVKHASPPAGIDPGMAAADLRERGLADVLVVSGTRTGAPTDPSRIAAVRRGVPDAPIWLGSGLTRSNADEMMQSVDGAIVGSDLHRGGKVGAGIDRARVRELVEALRGG